MPSVGISYFATALALRCVGTMVALVVSTQVQEARTYVGLFPRHCEEPDSVSDLCRKIEGL